MKGFGSFITVFSSVLTLVGASNVVDLNPKNFDKEILKGGRPALVEFFAVSISPSYPLSRVSEASCTD